MSDGKDDGLILLRTKSFVKGVFTSFSVTLPEDANSCVIVPCTMKAKQQQALLSVTVCVLQQCSSGADAVCNGVSSSPALAPCVSLKASKGVTSSDALCMVVVMVTMAMTRMTRMRMRMMGVMMTTITTMMIFSLLPLSVSVSAVASEGKT